MKIVLYRRPNGDEKTTEQRGQTDDAYGREDAETRDKDSFETCDNSEPGGD